MKIKLLVVDDNVNLVNLIKKYFEGNKSIVVNNVAYDGEEAVKIIEENPETFDVMLLDLIMPHKDGMYVLEYMKEYNIKKNVIVMT